jgi:hypothetical protein
MLHLLFCHVAESKAIHPGVQRSICSRQRKYLQGIEVVTPEKEAAKVRQQGSNTFSLGQR